MGLGLDEIAESTSALIDVPLRRSNAITPLWWWVQAVPMSLAGELSLAALRIMSLVCGVATLVLAYVCAAPRVGRGPATLFVGFAACSDVLAFTNARGEYAESLLALLVVFGIGLIGRPRAAGRKSLVWASILLTHLGKGLILVAAMFLADVIGNREPRRSRDFQQGTGNRKIRRSWATLVSLTVAVLPLAIWLGVAALRGPMTTDPGPVEGPLGWLRALTVDYRSTKAHMIGSKWEALQIWHDLWVWPLTTVSGPLFLVGAIAALARPRGRRGAISLGLGPWVLLGVALVAGRGMIGARFHLLYLPALWMLAAIGLWRLRAMVKRQHAPVGLRAPAALFACGAVVLLAMARGPVQWVPFSRFEPYAGADERAAIEAHRRDGRPLPGDHGRTLYIDLANYFLVTQDPAPRDLERARHYAELEVRRVPADPRAWFFLAKARQRMGEPSERILEAAMRSESLKPSAQAKHLIEEVRAGMPG